MSDKNIVHIGENSPEEVAFKLLQAVAAVEKKSLSAADASDLKPGWSKADRTYILSAYGECISAVRHGWHEPKR
ncbi:hypothetical protein U8C37_10170 [Sinorhizobium medicae]|uniref:hypothetical protein n=1 Tax=Sinorhizobium medicae TaxID=110321 RepID=UPI002AF6A55D|nr:hypothetical protein [Sinorhizobium medicae]WQO84034.1 hypothetical protein U8C37_10170 [Sinorhizobium medicae]